MFANRTEAGRLLAEELKAFQDLDPIILAIPRGGITIGIEIVRHLHVDFSIIVARKLGYPSQPEAAIGAIAEDKSLYLNPTTQSLVSRDLIEELIEREEQEIKRRISLYRNGRPLPPLQNRAVIIVDDGAATGATLFAVITMCKKQQASTIIVALPVSSAAIAAKLRRTVDHTIILEVPRNYYAVSQAYKHFENLSDREIVDLINDTQHRHQDPTQT